MRFCTTEGWTEVRSARGKPTGHHLTFELALEDGRVLRTRILRPAKAERYGRGLWSHLLRDQLDLTEPEFWACVHERTLPVRAISTAPPPGALPAWLVRQLIDELHLAAAQIAALDAETGRGLLRDHRNAL